MKNLRLPLTNHRFGYSLCHHIIVSLVSHIIHNAPIIYRFTYPFLRPSSRSQKNARSLSCYISQTQQHRPHSRQASVSLAPNTEFCPKCIDQRSRFFPQAIKEITPISSTHTHSHNNKLTQKVQHKNCYVIVIAIAFPLFLHY